MSIPKKAELDYKWFCLLFSKSQIKMSLIISSIVGTILNLINQGHLIITPEKINIVGVILTYFVPFCVSTLSSALAAIKHQKKALNANSEQLEEQHKVFFSCVDSTIQNITSKLSNDPNLLPENLAQFVNQLEKIGKSKLINDDMRFHHVREVINTGDLAKAFSIIIELVKAFTAENVQDFINSEERIKILCDQRQQLIAALQNLDSPK